jgi:hypothetical protein
VVKKPEGMRTTRKLGANIKLDLNQQNKIRTGFIASGQGLVMGSCEKWVLLNEEEILF